MSAVTPGPIDADDICVGDTVRATDVFPDFVVARIDNGTAAGGDMRMQLKDLDAYGWSRKWELVSRPLPKPQLGEHWLDEQGAEYIVIGGRQGLHLYPLEWQTRWPIDTRADVAPDGWTLKS